jgi:hypothetical protein
MKAQTNNDYYNILLEGCKEAFEAIELKEFLYTDEGMKDNKEVFHSKESVKQLGIDTSNNLVVNYQVERDIKVKFLRFLEIQQLIFERKRLIPRNDFYKKCLNSLNIKLTEWNKEGDRTLRGINDMGTTPHPLEFLEYMKWDIKNKSLQLIETPEPKNPEEVKKLQTKPIKPKNEFKDFFNKDVSIKVIEKIQDDFKEYYGKKMAMLIYLLETEFKLISYSLDSKTDSRKHFVDSLNKSKINMQPINISFVTHTYKLDITKFEENEDFTRIKEKLQEAIK